MKFLIKIFSPSIFIISILLLAYTFYKSEIIWHGEKRDYYLTYYLLFFVAIFFSILTSFLNTKIKEYLVISFISLAISLYLFEGYLTVKDQFSKVRSYEKKTGKKWDKRKKFEIYEDLNKINDKTVVAVTPENFISTDQSIFPLSGISNSQTINCNENGYYSIYQSDRYGFNNPNSEWDKTDIEYLLLGDSFTTGACVNEPNDIGSILRTLSNKSVLNLGQIGSGPIIEYATLREYLDTNVKKILWIYYEGNDLWNFKNEKKNNILIKYLNDLNFTQSLKFKQNEIDDLAKKKIDEVIASSEKEETNRLHSIFIFLRLDKIRTLLNNSLPKNQQQYFINQRLSNFEIKEIKQIFKLSKELAEKNNSKLYFIYLPQYFRYKINYDDKNYNLVKNIIEELKIPFIDIHKEVFEKEKNPLKLFPFEKSGHYNVEGYRKITKIIYKATKN